MLRLSAPTALAALVITGLFASPPADVATTVAASEVTICHLPGHDGDFVTFNWFGNNNAACDAAGGEAMIVGQKACERGHRANQERYRACSEGDAQPR